MVSKSLHTSTSWPLPLLLLVCVSWRSALGQLSVFNESTNHATLTWNRPMIEWEKKELFNVSLESLNKDFTCYKVVNCTTPICYLNTLDMCGELPPCCSMKANVYAVPYEFPSFLQFVGLAPEKVTNLTLRQEEGVEYISWDNPSPQTSHCHDNTEVYLSYSNFSSSYKYPANKQNVTLPLCVAGSRHVEVRAVANWTNAIIPIVTRDSFSDAATDDFMYESDEHMMVHIRSVESVNCTTGKIHWMLNTNCSSAAYDHIKVVTGERQDVVNMADTSFEITGLQIPYSYNICVLIMKEELAMAAHCIAWEMKQNAVENLRADSNNSTSITLDWRPPQCLEEPFRGYRIILNVNNTFAKEGFTYNTTHTFVNLAPLTNYTACVRIYEYYDVCRNIYTLPAGPKRLQVVKITQSCVRMSWEWQSNSQHVLFEVLWGKNLENKFITPSSRYTLDVDGDPMDVHPVCVAAIVTSLGNLTGDRTCRESPPDVEDEHLVPIVAGSVVGGLLVVVAAVGAAVVIRKKANRPQGICE